MDLTNLTGKVNSVATRVDGKADKTGGLFTGPVTVAPGDGNTYTVGKSTNFVGSNTPVVSGTSFTGLQSIQVGVGHYRFRAHITLTCNNTNGGSPIISYAHSTTAATTLLLSLSSWWPNNGGQGALDSIVQHVAGFPADNTSTFTMANGGIYTYIIDGWVSITSAGTIFISGSNTIAGGQWTQLSGSYFEVEPVL